jgi:enoyl-CoA hydratase
MDKEYKTLLYQIDGPEDSVCTITMNRPDKHNAINMDLAKELIDAFSRIRDEKTVKVVIFTGAGKSFCAGGDLSTFPNLAGHQSLMDWMARVGYDVQRSITENEKIVIAKVRGNCLAGGLEIALCCDLIYAAESTKFGLTEIGMGILPGWGGTVRLPRSMPIFRAREVVYTGRKNYLAPEIYEMGLLTRVFKDDELDDRVDEIARNISEKPMPALRMGKAVMNRSFEGMPWDAALTLERSAVTWLVYGDAMQAALAGFKGQSK